MLRGQVAPIFGMGIESANREAAAARKKALECADPRLKDEWTKVACKWEELANEWREVQTSLAQR